MLITSYNMIFYITYIFHVNDIILYVIFKMNRTHVFRILNEMIFFGKVQNRLEENKSSRVSDECVKNNRTPIILQIRSIVKSG